jgi:putative transposase
MPSRNTRKSYVPDSYYHVYGRGGSKQKVFFDDQDYRYFIDLIARYLSSESVLRSDGVPYPNFFGSVVVHAYCLMPNHYHLLLHQKGQGDISLFMKSLIGSYSQYFNLRYKRSGPVFEDRFKAVLIDDETYLHHISRYIHLNPRYWKRYPYSSFLYYRNGLEPTWLATQAVLALFDNSRVNYQEFIEDYQAYRDLLADLKHQLAD